jgi:hypothetical protein
MEIAIALDSYDDLFSDFDIRGYGERALSRDFLDELRVRLRRSGIKAGHNLVFLMPAQDRRADEEVLILSRLGDFFTERRAYCLREDRRAFLTSLLYIVVGLALSVGANFVVDRYSFLPLFNDFVLIPSWFFVWSGLALLVTERREIARKKRYYAALTGCPASFADREGYRGGGGGRS